MLIDTIWVINLSATSSLPLAGCLKAPLATFDASFNRVKTKNCQPSKAGKQLTRPQIVTSFCKITKSFNKSRIQLKAPAYSEFSPPLFIPFPTEISLFLHRWWLCVNVCGLYRAKAWKNTSASVEKKEGSHNAFNY